MHKNVESEESIWHDLIMRRSLLISWRGIEGVMGTSCIISVAFKQGTFISKSTVRHLLRKLPHCKITKENNHVKKTKLACYNVKLSSYSLIISSYNEMSAMHFRIQELNSRVKTTHHHPDLCIHFLLCVVLLLLHLPFKKMRACRKRASYRRAQ